MGVARELAERQAPIPLDTLSPEQIAVNNTGQILTLVGTLFAIAALIVLLRFYVRAKVVKTFGIDDMVMGVAMLCCTVCFVCVKIRTDNGLGRYLAVSLNNPLKYETQIKMTYVESIIILVGVSAVKVSVGFCLLRFSVSKKQSRVLYGSIAFIILFTIACCGYLIWECTPVEAAWKHELLSPPNGTGKGRCINDTVFLNLGLMNSVFNILTDAFFAVLPIPVVWKLQLNRRTRISLVVILSLGWFACVAAILKMYKQSHFHFGDNSQNLHDTLFAWYFVELSIGIIAASLPMLRPLFAPFFGIVASEVRRQAGFFSKGSNSNSGGFQNAGDRWDKNIALENVSGASVTTGLSSTGDGYYTHISADRAGREEKGTRENRRADSEERILHPQHAYPRPDSISVMKKDTSVV